MIRQGRWIKWVTGDGHGEIRRYELSNLRGINLVMDLGQESGVSESLKLDGYGKSWSFRILGIKVEILDESC